MLFFSSLYQIQAKMRTLNVAARLEQPTSKNVAYFGVHRFLNQAPVSWKGQKGRDQYRERY
jgi:hypothetical protein